MKTLHDWLAAHKLPVTALAAGLVAFNCVLHLVSADAVSQVIAFLVSAGVIYVLPSPLAGGTPPPGTGQPSGSWRVSPPVIGPVALLAVGFVGSAVPAQQPSSAAQPVAGYGCFGFCWRAGYNAGKGTCQPQAPQSDPALVAAINALAQQRSAPGADPNLLAALSQLNQNEQGILSALQRQAAPAVPLTQQQAAPLAAASPIYLIQSPAPQVLTCPCPHASQGSAPPAPAAPPPQQSGPILITPQAQQQPAPNPQVYILGQPLQTLPQPGMPLQTLPQPGMPLQTLPQPGQPLQTLPQPATPIQILSQPGQPLQLLTPGPSAQILTAPQAAAPHVQPVPTAPVLPASPQALPQPGTVPGQTLPQPGSVKPLAAPAAPTMPPASSNAPVLGYQRYTRMPALADR